MFSHVRHCATMATLVDKSSCGSVPVRGGLVNEAVVYDVSHNSEHQQTVTVCGHGCFVKYSI